MSSEEQNLHQPGAESLDAGQEPMTPMTPMLSGLEPDGATQGRVDKERGLETPTGPIAQAKRPRLLIEDGDLPAAAAAIGEVLAKQPHIFERAVPVRVVTKENTGEIFVEPLKPQAVIDEVHRVVQPYKIKRTPRTEERVNITLPNQVASLYLENSRHWNLRVLNGFSTAPLVSKGGTIRTATGYDEATKLWCHGMPEVNVPAQPTREEADAALATLRQHFCTFAFADAVRAKPGTMTPHGHAWVDVSAPPGQDESCALVALMTAVVRPSLWLAPAIAITAPARSGAGTGKGLLTRAICAIAFGFQPSAVTTGAAAEELDKRLTSMLIGADQAILLDNVNEQGLKSNILASAITERPASIRPLGSTSTIKLNPSSLIVVNGNGLRLSEDLVRRFIPTKLDTGTENPEARAFKGDFLKDTQARRAELLAAVLAIFRWGQQVSDGLPAGLPLGSFGDWGPWCRDPLLALGCQDPVARISEMKEADPERQALALLFNTWHRHHGSNRVASTKLHEEVVELIAPLGGSRQSISSYVQNLAGTAAGGFILKMYPKSGEWGDHKYAVLPNTSPNQ